MTIRRSISLALLLLTPLFAQAQDLSGDWFGILEGPGMRLTLHVTSADAGYSATMDSPDESAFGLPLDTFEASGTAVTFTFAATGIRYEGALDPATNLIDGTFHRGGAQLPLRFGRLPLPEAFGPAWAVEMLEKREVMIPMRDGVRLFTSIYTPRDTTQAYPILMNRTPYNSEPGGEDKYSGKLGSFQRMLQDGYIMVLQDVRGRWMSEGTFENIRPQLKPGAGPTDIDESTDTYDTIEWLVNNVPRNSGRVGVLGISYPGFYSTTSLPGAHPALKAVSPQAPVTNWFLGDDWHHNGAFFMMDAFSFYSSNGIPRAEPTRSREGQFNWPMADNYAFYLDIGPIQNAQERYLEGIEFWPDIMAHPNYDDFWKDRDPTPFLTDVKPAVLTVGGLFDAEDLYGPWAVYHAVEDQNPPSTSNRLLMGPWYHGQWASGQASNMGNVYWGRNTSLDYKEMEAAFFARYLKDGPRHGLAEATIFDTGALRWDSFDAWPPAEVEPAGLYLQPNGGLSFSPPTETESFDEYVADPMKPVPYTEDVHLRRTREYMTDDQRFASRRPDVMVYQTAPLTEAVTLTGKVNADLFVSMTGTDADFVVKLIDVFPDTLRSDYPSNAMNVPMAGYQMLVRGEIMRGKYRNSFEEPEPFTPGEVTRVPFWVPDINHTFLPGHRIMIQVQNSWFPLVDRNPQTFVNIYEADESDFVKATHRIYHDAQRPSRLEVHVRK